MKNNTKSDNNRVHVPFELNYLYIVPSHCSAQNSFMTVMWTQLFKILFEK